MKCYDVHVEYFNKPKFNLFFNGPTSEVVCFATVLFKINICDLKVISFIKFLQAGEWVSLFHFNIFNICQDDMVNHVLI